MPVDTSMYGMIKPVDVMGSVEKGMNMRDMIGERKKKSAIQDAFKQGMKTDPSGKVSFDSNLTASALAQGGYGEEAYQAQQQGQNDQQKQMQMAVQNAQFGAQVLGAARNQDEWNKGRQELSGYGMNTASIPEQYSPQEQQRLVSQAQTIQERLAEQWREKSHNLEREKLGAQRKEESSAGQKKLDQDWAVDYNEWTSGGADTAVTEIGKLQDVVNNLEAGSVSTGGMTGVLGDRLTSNKVLSARADVQSTVMSSLKAILGAQFTEKEGDRIIKNTWNEADSTANNAARIKRLIGDLGSKAEAKNKKSQYFKNNNATLAGFEPSLGADAGANRQVADRPQGGASGGFGIDSANAAGRPQVFKTNDIDWAD